MADAPALLLSCEHAGNRIPPEYRHLFKGDRRLLASHRGYDLGALACARALGGKLRIPLFAASCSRLLVDLNRSPGHPALFSERTRALSRSEKEHLLAHYYHPYRQHVEQWIRSRIKTGDTVAHIAIHSFTPVLNSVVRRTDVGLLYDPSRAPEAALCRRWCSILHEMTGNRLVVRRNHPYRGVNDGLTRHLRTRFAASRYIGVEVEINQRLLRRDTVSRTRLIELLASTLQQALTE